MNVRIPYLFESGIRDDNDNTQKIELSTSIGSNVEFDFIVNNFQLFKNILLLLDHIVMLKPASIEYSHIEYKDWIANKILEKITSDTSTFDGKPEAVKEVLNELIQRRDKLESQIQSTLDYIDNNKSKIDEMRQIRANHWKLYYPPFLTLVDQILIIEALSEYEDVYLQIGITIEEFFSSETEDYAPEDGYGWIEYSQNFSKDIQSLYQSEKIFLTNSKPRSDIRILGRSDQIISYIYQIKPSWLFNFEFCNKFFVKSNNYDIDSTKITFSQTELFQIVSLIDSSTSPHSKLNLDILPSNKFSVEFIPSDNILKIFSPDLSGSKTKRVQISNTLFRSLLQMVRYISSADLIVFSSYLPTYLLSKFDYGFILLSSNSDRSHKAMRNKLILDHYMSLKENIDEEKQETSPINILKSDYYPLSKGGYNPLNGTLYERILIENPLPLSLSTKEKNGILVYYNYRNEFINKSNQINLDTLNYSASIKIDDNDVPINTKCTCDKNHPRYYCQHVIACILFLILRGS